MRTSQRVGLRRPSAVVLPAAAVPAGGRLVGGAHRVVALVDRGWGHPRHLDRQHVSAEVHRYFDLVLDIADRHQDAAAGCGAGRKADIDRLQSRCHERVPLDHRRRQFALVPSRAHMTLLDRHAHLQQLAVAPIHWQRHNERAPASAVVLPAAAVPAGGRLVGGAHRVVALVDRGWGHPRHLDRQHVSAEVHRYFDLVLGITDRHQDAAAGCGAGRKADVHRLHRGCGHGKCPYRTPPPRSSLAERKL